MTQPESVLIVDFGSQVTQLIARRVREAGVYSEVRPYNKVDAAALAEFKPIAVLLSGGPPRAPKRRSSSWACRCWASATARWRWRSNWAAGPSPPTIASSVAPG